MIILTPKRNNRRTKCKELTQVAWWSIEARPIRVQDLRGEGDQLRGRHHRWWMAMGEPLWSWMSYVFSY